MDRMNEGAWREFQQRTREAASKSAGRGEGVVKAIDDFIAVNPVQTIRSEDGDATEDFRSLKTENLPFRRSQHQGITIEYVVDGGRTKVHLYAPDYMKLWDPIILDRLGQERGRDGRIGKWLTESAKEIHPGAVAEWVPELWSWYVGLPGEVVDGKLACEKIVDGFLRRAGVLNAADRPG
jgi:hypothetical protein